MLLDKTILELNIGLLNGDFTSVDLIEECYRNIELWNSKINAFITLIDKDIVLERARYLDKHMKDSNSKLFGLPYVLKDAYVTQGVRTTSASNVLKDFIPPYSATVFKKLEGAGAILLGKMNMDAWGHGGSSENTDFGPVRNPWDLERVAGGSSGGPAAAVSTRMAAFGIGEDTGGSIRNPAAWCGITGLKVSYGRVSRYGCIAYASSFDTVGPMAKSVEDCAIILEEIAGKDVYDATSSPKEVPAYTSLLKKETSTLTVGIPEEFYGAGLDIEIKEAIFSMAEVLKSVGVTVKKISMPLFDFGIPVYYLIGPSETSSNLARYDGIRYGNDRSNFSDETMRRIMIGTYALSAGYYDAYYKKAQKARTLFIKEYENALVECDILLQPVAPTHATKVGELINDPLQNLLADVYTTSQNPVGVPSLVVPCGYSKSGLPIGVQMVGRMFSEDILFSLGYLYQSLTDWHTRRPQL